jgi:hypothetical protein
MRSRWKRALVVIVVLGASAGTAAGPAGAATPQRAGARGLPKACALFTADIAAAALGRPVGPPLAQQPSPKETFCTYRSTDGTGARAMVVVAPWRPFIQVPGISLGQKISGIGDEAEGSGPGGVKVRKGSNGFIVTLTLPIDPTLSSEQDFAAELAADIAVAKQLVVNFGAKPKH